MEQLFKSFRATIHRKCFIQAGDSVLVGVSGGIDSMVLASLMIRLQEQIDFQMSLAHVNYGLRGRESDAQEKLVRDFAKNHRMDCVVSKADLPKKPQKNFQSMARDFRYHFFAETARQLGATKVAVAHHLEDQVETILAHLLRGTSLKGLSGMQSARSLRSMVHGPWSMVQLIRPLLSFSKEALKAYAAQNQISYIEDSSNASDKYWRNRLRHELLPVIQSLKPKAFGKIMQLGEEVGELNDYLSLEAAGWLEQFGKKDRKSFWLPAPRFVKLPRTLRLEILHQAYLQWQGTGNNLKRNHLIKCEQLGLGNKREGYYSLPNNVKFVRSGDNLLFETKEESR